MMTEFPFLGELYL